MQYRFAVIFVPPPQYIKETTFFHKNLTKTKRLWRADGPTNKQYRNNWTWIDSCRYERNPSYWMSKKSYPILYINLLYKMDEHFLNI